MKIQQIILAVFAFIMAGLASAPGQSADQLVAQGRSLFASNNTAGAHARFTSALALVPQHQEANALAAVTRLLLLPQRPAVSNLLSRLGVARTGRDIFEWTAEFTEDDEGDVVLPANLNSADGVRLVTSELMPAIRAALTNLSRINNSSFLLQLTAEETHSEAVDVDYGDVQLVRSLLHVALAFSHTLTAHNFGVNISQLRQLGQDDLLTLGRALSANPAFLGAGSAADLKASQLEFLNAVARYLDASQFIRLRPFDTFRLFDLDPDQFEEEAEFRDNLAKVLHSLLEPVQWNLEEDYFLYVGSYFAGGRTLRSLLPRFDGNQYVPGSLPDYTFGGLLIGMPPERVEQALLERFNNDPSGYYAPDIDNGSSPVAAFVRSNGLATVLGVGVDGPVFFEVQLDDDGEAEVEEDGVYFYISFDSGEYYGNIYNEFEGSFTDFYGTRVREGDLSAAAGYYKETGSGQRLRAIVTPDGQLFFALLNSSNEPLTAGFAQLEEDGYFEAFTDDGFSLEGNLNLVTGKITGMFDDGEGNDGNFSVSRNAFFSKPAAPVITQQPQDLTVKAGDMTTLAVTATGVRLQYQWYEGGLPLWRGTARTYSFKPPAPEPAEMFHVVVSNPYGSVTSRVAVVSVLSETVKPTVTFSSPANNTRQTSATATVIGRAMDNASVTQVVYRLNGGAFIPAQGTNDWNDWMATITLEPCDNVFEVKAIDSSGNESLLKSLRIVRVVNLQLTLTTNTVGAGSITPKLNLAALEQCKSYTLTAIPAAGQVFSNWTGGISSPLARLTFAMTPGLALQANFVPNPFPAVKGTYNGLAKEEESFQHDRAGFFSAVTTDNGSFSAQLILGGVKGTFSGKFALDGWTTNSVRIGTNTNTVVLQLDLNTNGACQITGTVSNGVWTAALRAVRAHFNATRPTSLDGAYTLAIAGSANDAVAPGGSSIGTVNVTKAGAVSLKATLADGTLPPIMQATALSKNGEWPLYVSLYGGKGSIQGWMTNHSMNTNLDGSLVWTRPSGVPRNPIYTNGFLLESAAIGAIYRAPAPGAFVLSTNNAVLVLSGADLSGTFSSEVTLGASGRVNNAGAHTLTMSIVPGTGLFSGTFIKNGTTRMVKFNGAVLRPNDVGYGYFLGTNQSGAVFFGPRGP